MNSLRFDGLDIRVGRQQAAHLSETIEQMKVSEARQLRAYMGAAVNEHPDISNPNGTRVVVEIKNYGQTLAYGVETWLGIALAEYPLQNDLPPPANMKKACSVAFPGIAIPNAMDIPYLGRQAISEISNGTLTRLYAWGEITYKDIFGLPHTTSFRLMMGGPNMKNLGLVWCEHGNEAD